MGSDYTFRGEMLAVSNGAAETINTACWRRLEALPPSPARDALCAHFEVWQHMGTGCLGFGIDEGPFADPEARRLFAGAVTEVALEAFAAIRQQPHDAAFDFLVDIGAYYHARWIAIFESLHDMVRRSLRGDVEPLILPVAPALRNAVEAQRIANKRLRHGPPYTRADVEQQRALLERALAAPGYFDVVYITSAFDQLADREEFVGDVDAALVTRARGLDHETDPEIIALGRELLAFDRDSLVFLRQIWAAPDDDGPREVFADWLLEQGSLRGEFINLQLRGRDPERQAQLLAAHAKDWLGALAYAMVEYRFERGFPAWCRVDPEKYLAVAGHPAWATVHTREGATSARRA